MSFSTPPPVCPSSWRRRSPSYYRRLKQRKDAREHLESSNVGDVEIVPPDISEEDTEQKVVEVAEDDSSTQSRVQKCAVSSSFSNETCIVNAVADAEVSCQSEVVNVCNEMVEKSDISAPVAPDQVAQNEITSTRNQGKGSQAAVIPSMMKTYAGQLMPNEAMRNVSSNGYPLPQLSFM